MQFSIEDLLREDVKKSLNELYGLSVQAEQIVLQATRKEFEGQMTLVVFPYVKAAGKQPQATAEEIGAHIKNHSEIVIDYNAVKGFLNMVITPTLYISSLRKILNDDTYGYKRVGEQSPLCMVEYSSPNTNKPLHLGHIRNNLLGYSIAQILEANGNRVVKTNIVNDRGIHICKSMVAWLKWGEGKTPDSSGMKGDHLVGDFYVLFDQKYREEKKHLLDDGLSEEDAEKASALMAEAREMLRKWEQGDPDVLATWRMMNGWVYEGFDETYQRLGVDFDKIYYESETYLVGKEEVLRGVREGIFTQEADGSVWADLTSEGLDRKILLRADGTSVYMTQDIGTAKMRYNDYPIDRMIYVVGNEQNYHFQVLSILLDKLGYEFGKSLKHFSYGMVELPDGKMKSREGNVVDADDLMDRVVQEAYQSAQNLGKMVELSEEESRRIAETVGLGALKYYLLKVDPRKNMTYDSKESIDFNGNTGPFIQYAYARIMSLKRKAKEQGIDTTRDDFDSLSLSEKELNLLIRLGEYPNVVTQAGQDLSPSLLANYAYELVREYNQFYYDHSVLNEQDDLRRAFRFQLSLGVAKVVKSAMHLLGIDVPDRM